MEDVKLDLDLLNIYFFFVENLKKRGECKKNVYHFFKVIEFKDMQEWWLVDHEVPQ